MSRWRALVAQLHLTSTGPRGGFSHLRYHGKQDLCPFLLLFDCPYRANYAGMSTAAMAATLLFLGATFPFISYQFRDYNTSCNSTRNRRKTFFFSITVIVAAFAVNMGMQGGLQKQNLYSVLETPRHASVLDIRHQVCPLVASTILSPLNHCSGYSNVTVQSGVEEDAPGQEQSRQRRGG